MPQTPAAKPYTVNYYCTHPGLNNDDCNTGDEFEKYEDAIVRFDGPLWMKGNYIEIDGPDIYEVRMKPGHDPKAYAAKMAKEEQAYNEESKREMAMEAGMLGGVHAYNDAMGCDSEPYEAPEH